MPSYILANLVIGQNVVPELVQEDCTPERLADTLAPLLGDTPERQRQSKLRPLDAIMEIGSRRPPPAPPTSCSDLRRAAERWPRGNANG